MSAITILISPSVPIKQDISNKNNILQLALSVKSSWKPPNQLYD